LAFEKDWSAQYIKIAAGEKGKGMKCVTLTAIVVLFAILPTGQNEAPTPPAASPAKSIGLFAYPKNKQGPDLQLKDENECYASAKQNSGVDPQAPPPAAPCAQDQQTAQQEAAQQAGKDVPKGGTVKGSAKGAAGGAAIGAIAGDAGTGAAIGATAGAMAGRRAQKKAPSSSTEQEGQSQADAQHKEQLDTFKRAFSACMDARGYSVQ
jgi:Glycine-zipper domain